MRRVSSVVLVLLFVAGFAGSASSAPVFTGEGKQRHFIWHAGDASVRTLTNTVEFESVDVPEGNKPIFASDPSIFDSDLPCPNTG